MLTEFSPDWWDEIEDVLKKIKNREIGPHAGQDPEFLAAEAAQDAAIPPAPETEKAAPASSGVEEAERQYESSLGIAQNTGSSASNTTGGIRESVS